MPDERILVVDDDTLGLKVFRLGLQQEGYHVVSAENAKAAKEILKKELTANFCAVVTDYRMPGESGLDLLEWVKEQDETLSVIMITSQREREVIQSSLRGGASDFLEKPVELETLKTAVAKACQETQRARQDRTNKKNVHEVAKMNQFFKSVLAEDLLPYLSIHYTPNDQVGGDFVNVLPLADDQTLLLVGDVSGHDLRAGFVSAYFQGLVRGLSYNKQSIDSIAESFNHILLHEWARRRESLNPFQIEARTTLSLLAAQIDHKNNTAMILNCGAPDLRIIHKDGSTRCCASKNPPLGWSSNDRLETEKVDLGNVNFILMGTDGVHDWADELGLNTVGLSYQLLNNHVAPDGTPPDDLLMLRYQHNHSIQGQDYWYPMVQFDGEDLKDIDKMVTYLWKTLNKTLPNNVKKEKIAEVFRQQNKALCCGCLCHHLTQNRFKLVIKDAVMLKVEYPLD